MKHATALGMYLVLQPSEPDHRESRTITGIERMKGKWIRENYGNMDWKE